MDNDCSCDGGCDVCDDCGKPYCECRCDDDKANDVDTEESLDW